MKPHTLLLHPYQSQILAKLLLSSGEGLPFHELLLKSVSSDHVNYHIKQLIRFRLISKINSRYILTDIGKQYASILDDSLRTPERQPSVSVLLQVTDDQGRELVSRRLKHPYFGKVGRITGKVRYGETAQEAAKRELYEETGLTAASVTLRYLYRKIRTKADSPLQDNFFFVFQMTQLQGECALRTPVQENLWITEEDFQTKQFDFYDDFTFHHTPPRGVKTTLLEEVGRVDGY